MHIIEKIFQESYQSWGVVCTCGWREKGITENSVKARFVSHARKPQ